MIIKHKHTRNDWEAFRDWGLNNRLLKACKPSGLITQSDCDEADVKNTEALYSRIVSACDDLGLFGPFGNAPVKITRRKDGTIIASVRTGRFELFKVAQ